jgi:DNA excision repair protein ERCC-4
VLEAELTSYHHPQIDLDDFNIENAYFRSFDVIVRRQLDPVWNKVGARTKQLISDLSTLRRLLSYLLTYDPLAFHAYLETILTASTSSEAGKQRTNNSPWLLTDAANVIFRCAKRRCYTLSSPINAGVPKPTVQPPAEDDDEAWAALDEVERDQERIEHERGANAVAGPSTKPAVINKAKKGRSPKWLPKGMDPTLEELPKWSLLADILTEIEQEIMRQEMLPRNPLAAPTPGTNTILILTSSPRTAGLISEFLCRMDPSAPQGQRAYKMLERRLRLYLWWKAKLGQREKMAKEAKAQGRAAPAGSGAFHMPQQPKDFDRGKKDGLSEALKKKDAQAREKAASRRRMRGAAPLPGSSRGTPAPGAEDDSVPAPQVPFPRLPAAMDDEVRGTGEMLVEAEDIAEFFATQPDTAMMAADFAGAQLISMDDPDTDFPLIPDAGFGTGMNMDDDYGLLAPSQTILVRSYSDDTDDRLLSELQPRYIVLFEPSLDFVRRIEVYRSSHPGLNVRVYFMVWQLSAEEHKFLAAQRKEKEAFERLIKERGVGHSLILDGKEYADKLFCFSQCYSRSLRTDADRPVINYLRPSHPVQQAVDVSLVTFPRKSSSTCASSAPHFPLCFTPRVISSSPLPSPSATISSRPRFVLRGRVFQI